MPCAVISPKTEPNGRLPPSCPRMYEPEGPVDSSKTSDRAQYENTVGGDPLELASDSSFAAFRMNPTFQWLSMLTTASLAPPPWPEYAELHSVLNDITCEVEYPAAMIALTRRLLSATSALASAESPPAPPG